MAIARPLTVARRICVVGAHDGSAGQLEQLLSEQGYLAWSAPDPRRLAEPFHQPPDVVLIDARGHEEAAGTVLAALGADQRTAGAALIVLLPAAPAGELLILLAN